MVLLSPEIISSQPFDQLLQHKTFSSHICALKINEVHLIQDWGDPSFQDAFHHIVLVHAHMLRGTVLIGLTATLLGSPCWPRNHRTLANTWPHSWNLLLSASFKYPALHTQHLLCSVLWSFWMEFP